MAYFRTPIVVLLGATGAGKSKLALELAQRFKGEIISADAMQMYHGLNIATNKVSEEELKKVQHHMIDMLDPLSQMVRVNDFRNTCLPIIEGLLAKNVIPFICGGTNYYIESLIWNILVDDAQSDSDSEIDHNNLPYQKDDDLSIPSEKMYSELLEVDPERASTLHFKERRKIYRSLQIYYRHGGKKHSDFIKDQRSSLGGSHIGGPLRYKNVCFLWVDTEVSILDKRCDSRVDKMIQRGLLDELEDFHRRYNLKRSTSSDYTIGIFQSIGFKEFHSYLNLEEDLKTKPMGKKMYEDGITALKIATHRYARRQIRWIRQRLLNPLNMSHLPVYRVDSSDPSKWSENVHEPSVEVIQSFIDGKTPDKIPVPLLEKSNYDPEDLKKVFVCETCEMQLKGIIQYRTHMSSKKHKSRLKKVFQFDETTPFFSLEIMRDSKSFKESDRLQLIKTLKRMSKGELTSLRIFHFLKGNEAMDMDIKLKESQADKHIQELNKYNILAKMLPIPTNKS
uniref:tRNA dimethylallyltransferase, mitochondriallike [Bombus terrestris] n=1 Tax=Lepeophtheirus salmonis TaxID=72036 RepID=A0A0K2UZ32_LEPSM